MAKYIDAEQLKQTIETSMDMQDLYLPSHFFDVIDGIQAADVVEVTRCKDCKWFNDCVNGNAFKIWGIEDYCSYGEKKNGQ